MRSPLNRVKMRRGKFYQTKIGKSPVVRRFPGPAGVLPKLKSTELQQLNDTHNQCSQAIASLIAECIRPVDEVSIPSPMQIKQKDPVPEHEKEFYFHRAPWKALQEHLSMNPEDPNCKLSKMTIKWTKKHVFKNPSALKVPFVAAIVEEEPELLRNKGKIKTSTVKLMDPSGSLVAAMDSGFVDSYGKSLIPGTAVALMNVRVHTSTLQLMCSRFI